VSSRKENNPKVSLRSKEFRQEAGRGDPTLALADLLKCPAGCLSYGLLL